MVMPNKNAWRKTTAPRFDGAWRPDQESETLSANKTLTPQDSTVQQLDPNGSDRTVTLPAEADCEAFWFVIVNTASTSHKLTVQDDGSNTIIVVHQDETGIVYCDGTDWWGWSGGKDCLSQSAMRTHLTTAQAVLMPDGPPTLEDGTAITKEAGAPTPGWAQIGNEEVVLKWAAHANPGEVAYRFTLPPDCDTDSDLVLHLLGTPSSTNDSPVFTVGYVSLAAGDAVNADTEVTGESGEFTANTTIEEKTFTLAHANVAAAPSVLTVVINPKDGQLGNDSFYLYGVWLEYTRKLLTS